MVKAANWLTHLEYDWESPVWRYWLEGLGQSHAVVRYDERGCGLSDRDVGELSVDRWVSDLEAVVDAAGDRAFHVARHFAGSGDRDRVRGASSRAGRADGALRRLRAWAQPPRRTRAGRGAGRGDPRRVGAPQPGLPARCSRCGSLPEGTPEQMAWYDELQRRTTSAENAARLYEAWSDVDVSRACPAGRGGDARRARPGRCRGPVRAGPAARVVDPEGEAVAARVGQPPAAARRPGLAGVPV